MPIVTKYQHSTYELNWNGGLRLVQCCFRPLAWSLISTLREREQRNLPRKLAKRGQAMEQATKHCERNNPAPCVASSVCKWTEVGEVKKRERLSLSPCLRLPLLFGQESIVQIVKDGNREEIEF